MRESNLRSKLSWFSLKPSPGPPPGDFNKWDFINSSNWFNPLLTLSGSPPLSWWWLLLSWFLWSWLCRDFDDADDIERSARRDPAGPPKLLRLEDRGDFLNVCDIRWPNDDRPPAMPSKSTVSWWWRPRPISWLDLGEPLPLLGFKDEDGDPNIEWAERPVIGTGFPMLPEPVSVWNGWQWLLNGDDLIKCSKGLIPLRRSLPNFDDGPDPKTTAGSDVKLLLLSWSPPLLLSFIIKGKMDPLLPLLPMLVLLRSGSWFIIIFNVSFSLIKEMGSSSSLGLLLLLTLTLLLLVLISMFLNPSSARSSSSFSSPSSSSSSPASTSSDGSSPTSIPILDEGDDFESFTIKFNGKWAFPHDFTLCRMNLRMSDNGKGSLHTPQIKRSSWYADPRERWLNKLSRFVSLMDRLFGTISWPSSISIPSDGSSRGSSGESLSIPEMVTRQKGDWIREHVTKSGEERHEILWLRMAGSGFSVHGGTGNRNRVFASYRDAKSQLK